METSTANFSFSVCLLLILGLSQAIGSWKSCPGPETTCGTLPVRFPFRIKGRQPEQCGYPGFALECSSTNHSVLELPGPLKLNVKNIDYRSQTIELYDPSECLFRHVRNLTLLSSPFHFTTHYLYNYTFFNCSIPKDGQLISMCLSSSTYQVYAVDSDDEIADLPLLFCRKTFNISSIPYDIFHNDATLNLMWSHPKCSHCESKGTRYRCGFKNMNTSYETACFEVRHTGQSNKFVITGSVLGLLLLVVALFAIDYIYNSYKSQKESQAIIEKFLKDYTALNPTRYSYAEIKRITNQFEDKLGEGSFGTVFKGNISSQFEVAVKILANSEGNGEEFITEVGTMGKVHHVNIIRLVGFCADGFRRALVYEYLPKGSLQNFINSPDNSQNFLGWKRLQEIVLGIAKGIEYLHQGCEQRILHFDIKPHNVLIDNDFTPKICDFGLAKLCSKDQSIVSMTNARGTLGYIAPEVFSRNFGNVSHKADVYSFGMLLLEVIGGRRITRDTKENATQIYYPEWIYNILEEREDMRIHIEEEGDAKIAKKLGIVGLWCIQWHAMDRPSMQVVVQMLEGQGDKLPVPPNPFDSEGTSIRKRASVPTRSLMQGLEIIQEVE
ncbi:rust resistance kinase Lr10-like isoform X1 [Prosopis cineraria]|uniref:rust resistance kinase Lr10-like isoform X1 n=1 Tax=Prosopis cineraria TaxID=364024 RepID=UPI00240F4F5D|nr:rust resistance kinase Lr10-like isoform X1 [Prosopis cineraria]